MRTPTISLIFLSLLYCNIAWADDEAGNAPRTATDKIVTRFMELDSDTTQSVSFAEYMSMVKQRARARFASMDRNRNGEVTAKEYRAFWKAQKSQYYRLKR